MLLMPGDLRIQPDDLLRRVHLGQQHDVRRSCHRRRQIGQTVAFQRIDPHGGDRAGLAPGRVQRGRQTPRLGPAFRRGEILQFLNQHIGAAGRTGIQRRQVGAGQEMPGTAELCGAAVWHEGFRWLDRVGAGC